MSELSRLHQQIVTGITVREDRASPARRPDVDDGFEDADLLEEPALVESTSALHPALAGAALLVSATALGIGVDTGAWAWPVGLAVAGMAGGTMLRNRWRRAGKPKQAIRERAAERSGDRQWEAREASQAIFDIHDAFGDPVVLRDGNGVIVEANETFRRLTGWLKPEGLRCESLGLDLPSADASGRLVTIVTATGPRRFDWHEIPSRDPITGILGRLGIGRSREAETTLALAPVLAPTPADDDHAGALERAKAESAEKSRLLATVSHEIRTPLSGILGMSNLLNQTRLTGEQANYLAGMRQSGHALVQLVEDLLDFSSLEAGRFTLRPSRQPLRATVESVVEMLAHRAHEKGIEIAATVSVDVPEFLEFDAPRLKQVLFNVVGNAVKFTTNGGVLVSARVESGHVVLTVADTGPGLTAEEQHRIFDAFEQAGTPLERAGGAGLGLSISRRIMTAFGGDLTVESRKGEGSTFTLRFPALGAAGAPATDRARTLAGTGILLIAPEGPAATALMSIIATLGGRCVLASTTQEARRQVADHASGQRAPLTDIIVDHRHAGRFRALCAAMPEIEAMPLRRTYLVNPEERGERPLHQTDGFHAWLIRPLRERSLVDVLKGRMKGIEVRDATNDNRPVLREMAPESATESPMPVPAGILLGEDDPVNARILATVLAKSGHAVRLLGDFDAIQAVLMPAAGADPAVARPALLVTDLNMPGGDGLTMLRRLRLFEDCADVARLPVVVHTSDAREETRRDLIAAGADAVLVKPAEPAALIEAISRLIAP